MNNGREMSDIEAIHDLINMIETGWNEGNGGLFAAPFASDADYVVVNGMYINGRETIANLHNQIFSTIYKGSRNHATVEDVRFLRPDIAVARVAWELKFQKGDVQFEERARNTLVLEKNEDEWTVTAFHNTPIKPPEQERSMGGPR